MSPAGFEAHIPFSLLFEVMVYHSTRSEIVSRIFHQGYLMTFGVAICVPLNNDSSAIA